MAPLYALSTILMIAYAAVFTLLAEIRNDFGFTETGIGVIAGSAFIAGFVAQLALSRFADSGQGGLLMRAGIVISLLGAAWMCVASELWAWVAARTVLGFGAGCVRPAIRRLAFIQDPSKAGENLGKLAAWEMVGFLIGPVLASLMFEFGGLRAPFVLVTVLLLALVPFIVRTEVPGADNPLPRAMRTLIKRPAMQACIAMGVAFYIAIGVFDAIWALFMADMGASQLFIGVTMSLFTLPMILIAPWAGSFASRQHVLGVVTVTMTVAMGCMVFYGLLESIWWMCIPMLVHAIVDAISMPATQLAVGYASGESALAAGQGLFGAVGLVVAAFASIGSGAVYQAYGAEGLWFGAAAAMALCIAAAWWIGRGTDWRSGANLQLS